MLVPEGTNLFFSEDIFHNIEREITLLHGDSVQKYDPYNLKAILISNSRVMVKWTNENNANGWKTGCYTAVVKNFIKVLDIIHIKYVCEPGKVYRVNVKESVSPLVR